MVKRKNLFKIICALLIIMLCAFFFIACNKNKYTYSNIEIDENSIEITSSGYNNSLNSFLSGIVNLKVGRVPVAIAKEITDLSNKADELLRSYNITESQYKILYDDLVKNGTAYSVSVYNLISGNNTSNDVYKSFISINIRTLGKDVFSNYVYDIINYRLNYIYESEKASFEKTGIGEEDVVEALYNYNTFKNKISISDFNKVFCNGMIVLDLLSMSKGKSSFLTDTEISTLIQIPDFSNDVDSEGWTLILKLLGNNLASGTFNYELFNKIISNNELSKFGEKIPSIIKLISSVQVKLTPNVISKLSGGVVDILFELIPVLSNDEWELMEEIFDISVNSNYWQIAYKYYGEDFLTYRSNVTLYTVQDLKTATKENIGEIFEGVIASISPAFSYGWKND